MHPYCARANPTPRPHKNVGKGESAREAHGRKHRAQHTCINITSQTILTHWRKHICTLNPETEEATNPNPRTQDFWVVMRVSLVLCILILITGPQDLVPAQMTTFSRTPVLVV